MEPGFHVPGAGEQYPHKLALGTAGLRSAALAAYFLGTTPVVGARERKIRSEK